jgi:hypothetical protein
MKYNNLKINFLVSALSDASIATIHAALVGCTMADKLMKSVMYNNMDRGEMFCRARCYNACAKHEKVIIK